MKTLAIILYAGFLLTCSTFVSCSNESETKEPQTLSQTVAENFKNNPDDWIEIKSDFKMTVDSNLNFVKVAAENYHRIVYYQNKKCGICIEEGLWGTKIITKNGSAELNMDGRSDIISAIYNWEDQKRIKAEKKILEGICK